MQTNTMADTFLFMCSSQPYIEYFIILKDVQHVYGFLDNPPLTWGGGKGRAAISTSAIAPIHNSQYEDRLTRAVRLTYTVEQS